MYFHYSVVDALRIIWFLIIAQTQVNAYQVEKQSLCAKDKVDLVFLIDSSTSVAKGNFTTNLKIVQGVVQLLFNNRVDSHIGLTKFTGRPVTELALGKNDRIKELMKKIEAVRYVSGVTHLGMAIQHVAEKEYVGYQGDRPDVANVVVIMSDGLSQDDILQPSTVARLKKIDFVVVAFGKHYGKNQLMEITDGRQDRIIRPQYIYDFEEIVSRLYKKIMTTVDERCSGVLERWNEKSGTNSTLTTIRIMEENQNFNNLQSAISTKCSTKGLQVTISNRQPFRGWIYVRKQDDPMCKWNLTNNVQNEITITVDYKFCGGETRRSTNPSGLFVSTSILMMQHPVLFQKNDSAYRLECFYGEGEKTLQNELNIEELTTTKTIESVVEKPDCTYTVRRGSVNGPVLKFATLGTEIVHRWECESPEMNGNNIYSMHVHSCFIKANAGLSHIMVIDENGCPTRHSPIRIPDYSTSGLIATAKSTVVSLPDSNGVQFNCQISLCLKGFCKHNAPLQCDSAVRTARNTRTFVNSSTEEFLKSNALDVSTLPFIVIDSLEPKNKNIEIDFTHAERSAHHGICISTWKYIVAAALISSFVATNMVVTANAVFKKRR